VSYRAAWQAAHELMFKHCDHASLKATMNADDAVADGHFDAYRFWLGVIDAPKEIGRKVPVDGERLN
jgi:hypothetical protein